MRVLLFKGSADDALDVAYAAAITAALGPACTCEQLPVLAFERVPASLPAVAFTGVVVTSARVAWAVAGGAAFLHSIAHVRWFVVGPATARAVRALGVADVVGEASGSAQALFDQYLSHLHGANLVFLCGDQRRPTIPELLTGAQIAFSEVVVYRTVALDDGQIGTRDDEPVAAVFFSPSGASAVQRWSRVPEAFWQRARAVAIGPTTAQAMARVDAVCSSPTPQAAAAACVEVFTAMARGGG